jgi:hypothetical protein
MRLLSVTLSAVTFASTAAGAQPSITWPMLDDARCLLAMVALSNSNDPNAQRFAQGGIIYFTGRIAGRDPTFDLARLKSLAATMDLQSAQTDLQERCGPIFERSLQQLDAVFAPSVSGSGPASPPISAAPK